VSLRAAPCCLSTLPHAFMHDSAHVTTGHPLREVCAEVTLVTGGGSCRRTTRNCAPGCALFCESPLSIVRCTQAKLCAAERHLTCTTRIAHHRAPIRLLDFGELSSSSATTLRRRCPSSCLSLDAEVLLSSGCSRLLLLGKRMSAA
jgi:hypothetical protein